MCLLTLKRHTNELFPIKALQSQLHLDAERTDFSERHLPFSDPSIQGSVYLEKTSYSKTHLIHYTVSSALISTCQMAEATLE